MKIENLQKAVVTARAQARSLERQATQRGEAAQKARDKARQAKGKLKTARREAKQARKQAKEAKRAFARILSAADAAATEAARLERKLQKSQKKLQQARVRKQKSKPTVIARPVVASPRSPKPKKVPITSQPKSALAAKPPPQLGATPEVPSPAPSEPDRGSIEPPPHLQQVPDNQDRRLTE
jgi:hypothetical protein